MLANLKSYLVKTDNKEELRTQYNKLGDDIQQFRNISKHADDRINEISTQMSEILAKLQSLGAFGEKK